ncbi:MAG: adenylate/guanylate cyclase domain-containing protein [Candidatus Acidiferrales bacterium]|jgi:adenylate cyclase
MAQPKSIINRTARLLREWWEHKGSLAISLLVTLFALGTYYVTFLGERPMPVADFVKRMELSTLDTRYEFRGRTRTDPRIIIVDVDQESQEQLGRWPFPRIHFAHLLDALREDGARVVAFDITFSKPDETVLPLQELSGDLAAQQKKGRAVSSAVLSTIENKEKQYNYDQQVAEAIQRFGNVVLGSYFLYTKADLAGVSSQSLDEYANQIAYFPFPQVRPLPSAGGEQGRVHAIQLYEDLNFVPRGAEANAAIFTEAVAAKKGVGFFNVFLDADSVVRHVPLAIPYGRDPDRANWDFYASLEVQTVRLYLGLSDEQVALTYGGSGIVGVEFGKQRFVRTDDISRLLVNYRGPVRTYPYVSFANAALKKFPPGTFKDKIVLVGASATGIGDLRATPFGGIDFPGTEIHANVIDNILNQQFIAQGGMQALTDVGFILLFGIPLGIWLAMVQPRWMILGLAFLFPFAGIVYWAFLQGWWLNFIVPAVFVLIPNVSLVALYRVLIEEQEKRKVRGAFQQYVSPEVIRRLLSDPERVKPRKTEVTVLFSDIRGFTTISETLDAQTLADLLNGYLTEMTRIIFRHQGTLDKYIGDAVMAIWGAPFDEPNHAERCCLSAVSMLARLSELQVQWRAQDSPVLEIGIGINTGIASVGNMGSSLRHGYTALGDAVNLAARLEGLNKEYGTQILISEFTRRELRDDQFIFREIDFIRVKGKLQPVTIYEILGPRANENGGEELVALFASAREAYKRRDWRAARSAWVTILQRWPDDGPSRVFLARCEEYIAEEPPVAWDGVYAMKHK